jgi:hypothetical protein
MARNATGKWVTRAASTGGGRTYRGQMPVNWYAVLVLIVLIGFLSVVYSRYEYQHPASAKTVEPTTSTTWYSGIAFNICGTTKVLPASTNANTVGLYTPGSGVVTIHPKNSSEAGNNATLGRFVSNYAGLLLSSKELYFPGDHIYKTGVACAKGTPDAGKVGVYQVKYYPHVVIDKATVLKNPAVQKLGLQSYVSVEFAPAGTKIVRSSRVEQSELQAVASGSSTTPTSGTTSVTVPGPTPTTHVTTPPSTPTSTPSSPPTTHK